MAGGNQRSRHVKIGAIESSHLQSIKTKSYMHIELDNTEQKGFRRFILGLQLTSPPPCWMTGSARFSASFA